MVDACGFAPRGDETQVYRLTSQHSDGIGSLCLSGTAEVPVASMFLNQTLNESQLPLKVVAFNHCFRAEAGAAGSTTRGLYRVHQFSKVEMFALCQADVVISGNLLDEIVSVQRDIVTELGLPYQLLDMPANDLGAPG